MVRFERALSKRAGRHAAARIPDRLVAESRQSSRSWPPDRLRIRPHAPASGRGGAQARPAQGRRPRARRVRRPADRDDYHGSGRALARRPRRAADLQAHDQYPPPARVRHPRARGPPPGPVRHRDERRPGDIEAPRAPTRWSSTSTSPRRSPRSRARRARAPTATRHAQRSRTLSGRSGAEPTTRTRPSSSSPRSPAYGWESCSSCAGAT
jgi:hypothetical protein